MSKQPFNNRRMTRLLQKFSKDKTNIELRNKIMEKTLPLIDAAISKKGFWNIRGDLQQECALKCISALSKYNSKRGDAFGFLWTVICNTCLTHAERLSRPSLSLDESEPLREAENTVQENNSPEMVYVVKLLSAAMNDVLDSGNLRLLDRGKIGRLQEYLKAAALTGDLFNNRRVVVKRLRRLGLDPKESSFLVDKTLISVRAKLYDHKVDLTALKPKHRYYASSKHEDAE